MSTRAALGGNRQRRQADQPGPFGERLEVFKALTQEMGRLRGVNRHALHPKRGNNMGTEPPKQG